MLSSSGGIHTIPEEYVRSINTGTEKGIFAVEKIADFLGQGSMQIGPLCQTPCAMGPKMPPAPRLKFF